MLQEKIKVETLRTFILSYGSHYSSIDLAVLEHLFSLSRREIESLLSKMILSRELFASFENNIVVMHRVVPSKLQSLSIQLGDRTREYVEVNEGLLDRLVGGGTGGDRERGERSRNRSYGKDGNNRRRDGGGGNYRGGSGNRDYNNNNKRDDRNNNNQRKNNSSNKSG